MQCITTFLKQILGLIITYITMPENLLNLVIVSQIDYLKICQQSGQVRQLSG